MATITTDFGAIQTRNIDPHSPVTSENHNKLLKTFGNTKMYVNGFDITFTVDATEHKILANVGIGTAYVQYMVIEMTSDAMLEVSETPTNAKELYIVLEYTYRAIKPVPIAYLKVIRSENYTPENQLLLYGVNINTWSGTPSRLQLQDWLDDGNLVDYRTSTDNTPTWANATYLRIDGSNVADGLKIKPPKDGWSDESDGTLVVNKEYVDNQIANHNDQHRDFFVKKYIVEPDDEKYNKIEDYLDVYMPNPYLKLSDMNDSDKAGIKITAASNVVEVELTKSRMQIVKPGVSDEEGKSIISDISADGVTGAIWSDIAEYFVTDMTEMPEQGACICVKNGKAVLSDMEADTSVIGCVSYKPAYILGGTTDFKKEFEENHKIPVAIIGQIKDVKVYAETDIYSGALLISGKDGCFKAINPSMCNGSHIGKVLVPVHKGHGKYYCLIK